MWKKMLITALFVLLSSFTAFAQSDGNTCPTGSKEVRQKVEIDVGVGRYQRETRECKEQEPKEKREQEKREPREKPEPREPRDKSDKSCN
jgi:hypothetical protein